MFLARDGSLAEATHGVTVRIHDEGTLLYVRHGRALTIPLEIWVDEERLVIVYAASIHAWDMPHRMDAISSIERVGILREIGEALDALGVKHRIEA